VIGDKLQGFPGLRHFKSHVDIQINHFPVEVYFLTMIINKGYNKFFMMVVVYYVYKFITLTKNL